VVRRILRVVGLAIVVAGDSDDRPGICRVGLVKAFAVHVDVAGEIDHVAQMIAERGDRAAGARVIVLRHHRGDEIHLRAARVAGVSEAMKDKLSGIGNLADRVGVQELRQVETVRRRAVGGRQWLEREMRQLVRRGLHRQRRPRGVRLEPGPRSILPPIVGAATRRQRKPAHSPSQLTCNAIVGTYFQYV
jgi:hypothetical protein